MTAQTVKLSELVANDFNPRQGFNDQSLQELANSIQQKGIVQAPLVTKNSKGYTLIDGERRLRALHILKERGDIDGNYEVPVTIRKKESKQEQLKLSVIANVQREQMHPLDEAEAFFKLTKKGVQLDQVAAESGVSIAYIKRRLLLTSLIEKAKQLFREKKLNLSAAEALAMGNADDQKAIVERLNKGVNMNADQIHSFIKAEKPSVAMAIFDVERYTGRITKTLFDSPDESYFDDKEQFFALQDEAVMLLQRDYEELDTVEWVEICYDYYFEKWMYNKAENGEQGGVVIQYNPDGRVEIHEGLVKPEIAAMKPKEKPEFSKKAYSYFANQKTLLVQDALANNIRKAKEVDILQRLKESESVSIQFHQAIRLLSDDSYDSALIESVRSRVKAQLNHFNIPFDDYWYMLMLLDYDAIYDSIKSLTDDELDQLFAVLVALSFGQKTLDAEESTDSLFHEIARDLEIKTRTGWTPDAEYFTLHRKDQLLQITKDSGASMGKLFDHLKKKELVSELTKYFNNKEPLKNKQQEELRQSYCPKLMRFEKSESTKTQ